MVRGSGASIASRPKHTWLGTLQLSSFPLVLTQSITLKHYPWLVIHLIYIPMVITLFYKSSGILRVTSLIGHPSADYGDQTTRGPFDWGTILSLSCHVPYKSHHCHCHDHLSTLSHSRQAPFKSNKVALDIITKITWM